MTSIIYSQEALIPTWEALCAKFERLADVTRGTMMRRPALLAADKTFVFLARIHGPGMGARVGHTEPSALGLRDWRPLQPFRGKAPMKGWVIVGPEDRDQWVHVARAALDFRRREVRHA
ncbi:MAG: hypothetical protein R3B13_40680 [Polyangiaceae bacterium]